MNKTSKITTTEIFKPSPIYKELQLLQALNQSNNVEITQRYLAKVINVSLSMINEYLTKYEEEGYIVKKYHSKKTIYYSLTDIGNERRKTLNFEYLKASFNVYNYAREECLTFLSSLYNKGYKNILFYGAGEVAELFLNVLDESIKINVVAIIDDDINKQGCNIKNINIISINDINKYNYDCIFISSHTNEEVIKKKLLNIVSVDKIITYFK